MTFTLNDETTELKLEWDVTPLFSKVLSIAEIDNNTCSNLQKICSAVSWIDDNQETGYLSGYSENREILDKYLGIKQYLNSVSLSCIKGILNFDTEIQITTSWFTRTFPNGYCTEHSHCNSWYSAVLYFGDYDDSSSKIMFKTDSPRILVDQIKNNFLNSTWLTLSPQQGMIIIFPSEVRHLVTPNNSENIRYSLAFNIMPKGTVGKGDSSFTYK